MNQNEGPDPHLDGSERNGNSFYDPPEESQASETRILREALARTLRIYAQESSSSNEEFAARVGINRGHLNEILNKKVDPKLSTVFRMTRRVDRCPNVLLCEICARTFGPCVHAIDPEDVVPDVKTLRDLHSGHPNRRESDCS